VLQATHRYFFVGAGGIGMSAIAQVMLARGFRVGGSDAKASAPLARLQALGAEVSVGHDGALVRSDDVLVVSDAIKADNPELLAAQALGLTIYKRADVLAALTNMSQGLAVSGTHGKTTTSGMLTAITLAAGMNPTCILGGELPALGGNARVGGDLTVVEACEAYNSFLALHPHAAIITNIEVDHLDFHGTPEHLFASFRQFLGQVRALAVLNGDDPRLREMGALAPRTVTYGLHDDCDYRITEVVLGPAPTFALCHGGRRLGICTLQVPGMHNVSDAAGAAALALELGASWEAVVQGLAAFGGMRRRFERLGMIGAVAVVDDYAHHPTEIRATLAAARLAFPGRVVAVFQPHLYSRTRDLLEEFAEALSAADAVLVAPIFAAREAPMPGIDHHQLVARTQALAPACPIYALDSLEEAVGVLRHAVGAAVSPAHPRPMPALAAGDVIITVGAGDVDRIAHQLVAAATE
jgi:UDP-N-acetylmuramate--alanine ligase